MPFSNLKLSSITQIETGVCLSSSEFQQKIKQREVELAEKYQITSGICILMLQNNSIEFFINLLAIFNLKATAIPMDPNSSLLEIETITRHANVSLVITDEHFENIQSNANEATKDTALILYTSGTTGDPKGILISYGALIEKLEVLSCVIKTEERKSSLCALPTYFGHGLICNSLFPIFYSENFFIAKKFDLMLIVNFVNYLEKYNISFFSSVPSVWDLILNFCPPPSAQLTSLKRVHCASSLLSREKATAIKEWIGDMAEFYNIFGITEMLGWVAGNKITLNRDPNLFEEFWYLQKEFSEEGELCLKSKYMFSGYLKNDLANGASFTKDGFFKTGDLFKEMIYKGRSLLIVNKNGIKIYPQEIDHFLLASGMVADSYTFAIKNKFSGEIIGVLLTLKGGCTLEQVKEYCLARLSPTKFPDRFFLLDKIVRNARGKISMEQLQQFQNKSSDE
ncbi:MAG: long-chain fatty acid--CoA ligase [Bacteriovorax sp.]|jgi:acyl-CoA synthetase (AMP-forming)/AMP-acid ligase II